MKMTLVRKKAADLRSALLVAGIARSPDNAKFSALPPDRQAPWLALAMTYLALFNMRFDAH